MQAGPGASSSGLTVDDLRDRPDLVAAFRVARAWGVAPTAFLGGARYTVVHHTYDDLGRLGDVIHEVPGWTEADREAAYALAGYEAGLCGGCGHDRAATTARENEFAWLVDAAKCHACAAAGRAADQYASAPGSQAISFAVRFDPARVRPELAEGGGHDAGRGAAGAAAAGEPESTAADGR
jgi:hypothetical protein